jgi:ATP-dependent DNA ligase
LDFDVRQSRQHDDEAQLYAFGMLARDGDDYRKLPRFLRKQNLAQFAVPRASMLHVEGRGRSGSFRAACKMGLEGLVSKHRERAHTGGRCAHWVKVKNPQHQGYKRVEIAKRAQHWRTKQISEIG